MSCKLRVEGIQGFNLPAFYSAFNFQPAVSVGHHGHGRAPFAVLGGTADGAHAHIIDGAGREAGDEDVLGAGKNPRFLPRAGAGGELHLICLRIGDGSKLHEQLGGEGIIQSAQHRLDEGRLGAVGVDHVIARGIDLRQRQRGGETLNIGGVLAEGHVHRIARLVGGGGGRDSALGGGIVGILQGRLQSREVGNAYGQGGEQEVVFKAYDHEDREAIELRSIVGRKV